MANKFALRGHHIEVDYTIGGNPSFVALTFKQGSFSKSFTPNEIRTDPTALGSLVSVRLATSVDTGGKVFAFVLPEIEVPQGETDVFTTVAVIEEFSGPNSVPRRPTTWRTFVMEGTAQTVIMPL
jgi:hypothetical protein